MLHLTVALDIVLATYEVPHEIAPVHEVHLVVDEELDIVELCGYLDLLLLSSHIDHSLTALDATYPTVIKVHS